MAKHIIRLLLAAMLLVACASETNQAQSNQALVPTQDPATAGIAELLPTQAVPSQGVPSQGVPTPSQPVIPVFVEYREPRGAFVMQLPNVWDRRGLNEGLGVQVTANNTVVRYVLSLLPLDQALSADELATIAEQYKQQLLADYLVQADAIQASATEQSYTLFGQATLIGTPSTIEITLRQTEQGTLVLQSWIVPTELWADFVALYKTPIESSLVLDESVITSLTP